MYSQAPFATVPFAALQLLLTMSWDDLQDALPSGYSRHNMFPPRRLQMLRAMQNMSDLYGSDDNDVETLLLHMI